MTISLAGSTSSSGMGSSDGLISSSPRRVQSWRLCFEYGFFAYLQQRNSAAAVEYMTRASRLPGAPPAVARLAAFAAGQAGESELAIELWREMLRSTDNEEERRIARRYLRRLGAPEVASFAPEENG